VAIGGPDGAEVEEFREKLPEVSAHLGGIARERVLEGQSNLGDRERLGESLPDEGRHLVQRVDGLQVADLAADRHQDGFAGNGSGDKLLGALISHVLGQADHGTET